MDKIRVNFAIHQQESPLLHDELIKLKPRARAKRLEQLAYFGMLAEKKFVTGVEIETKTPTLETAQVSMVSLAEPKTENTEQSIVENKNTTQVLVVPDGFGEDMSNLFSSEISLNVN